jgi:hypothetical protein
MGDVIEQIQAYNSIRDFDHIIHIELFWTQGGGILPLLKIIHLESVPVIQGTKPPNHHT